MTAAHRMQMGQREAIHMQFRTNPASKTGICAHPPPFLVLLLSWSTGSLSCVHTMQQRIVIVRE
jgi:hypothetical protein